MRGSVVSGSFRRRGSVVALKQSAAVGSRLLAVTVAAMMVSLTMSVSSASAATGTVLHTFTGGGDGATPQGALVSDTAGTLYGTTTHGGAGGDGTVYRLTRSGSTWTGSVIHSFGTADGMRPMGPLAIDGQRNLYGTTYQGGAYGHGAVFQLSPGSGGAWTYRLLYSFTGGDDGGLPTEGVVLRDGKLYGTASRGGAYGQGVAFKLTNSGGGWTQTVLHQFISDGVDGRHPGGRGALTFDESGNLYGVAGGGSSNAGVVYRLSPNGDRWTQTLLHTFADGADGADPLGSLFINASGTIYGTTSAGGSADGGTVYQLTRSGSTWTKRIVYDFPGGASGRHPYAGVIGDAAGNLYGTTASGVQGAGGVVYRLAPSGSGWTQSVLYTFKGAGNGSFAGLIRDGAGVLYGTNAFGGAHSSGEVVSVRP